MKQKKKRSNKIKDRMVAGGNKQQAFTTREDAIFPTVRSNKIKGRMVYNGTKQRQWFGDQDKSSPMVSLEGLFLTVVIDAHERRDMMTCDVPNAFIQAHMPAVKEGEDRVMMKITGVLVDMLVEIDPRLYGPYVVFENGRKVLYVLVLRAIYGQLNASLLWYKKLRKDLESIGFKFNPYDPCVANRQVQAKQQTVRFHVDDLMSSHVNAGVNTEFGKWLNKIYGKHGAVEVHRGKKHDYLGMVFDFTNDGEVKIDMVDYVTSMVKDFPESMTDKDVAGTPALEGLFDVGTGEKIDKQRAESFHTTVAKGLFVSKRARPDICLTIALLCTRVQNPNESDWNKLKRLVKYLNGTQKLVLTLSAGNLNVIKWYVDASFAVHPDFKSHTGALMEFEGGKGAVQSLSRKQRINTKSSCISELVAADDVSGPMIWTK